MIEEMKVVKAILVWLWKTSKPWEYPGDRLLQIYAQVQNKYFSWSNDNELESMYAFETRLTSVPSRRYLYLRATKSQMVPILDIAWDQSRSTPELRLRVGLFLIDEKDELKAFGYRFESPETEGVHHYYHAQYIHGFDKDLLFWADQKTWVSDECPTFPLDADSPVKLIVSVLVALYGKNFVTEIRTGVPEVETYISQMNFFKPFPLKWYRKVTFQIAEEGQDVHYYRIEDPERFQDEMRQRNTGCRIEAIFPSEYDEQPRKARLDWP